MFIPITHERTSVGRLPWVSFGVVALCLAVFAWVQMRSDDVEASGQAFGQAFVYFIEHPYLDADPRLVSAAGVEQVRRQLGDEPPAAAVPELHQRELDRLTAAWLASLEDNPLWRLGMVPDEVRPFGTVAYMFTHGGWLHLLGNLLFFYLTAPFVEDRFGHLGFAVFYLAAGVVAGFAHCLHYPHLHVPLVGASGAISATMGAFVVLFGRTRIRILTFILLIPKTFEAPAWAVFPLWFLTDLVLAVQGSQADPAGLLSSTAYWAHVGGFVVGLGVAFVFVLVSRPQEDVEVPATVDAVPAAVALARSARIHGRMEEAWRLLRDQARTTPDDPAVVAALWQLAVETGRVEAVAPLVGRRVRAALREGEPEEAWGLWQELDAHAPAAARRPDLAVAIAEALPTLGRRAEGEALLREAVAGLGPDTPIGVLLKLFRLTGGADVELRRRVAAAVLTHPQTPPDLLRQVEGELIVPG